MSKQLAGGFDWEQILHLGTPREFQKGSVVFRQADPTQDVWYIKEGQVKLSVIRRDGSEKTLLVMGPRSTIGEAAVFDNDPFRTTATALTRSVLYSFNRGALEAVIRSQPEMALHFIESLSRKVRFLAYQIEDLVFLDAAGRVASVLLYLSEESEGARPGEIRITHQELANLAGSNRVTVSNALGFLADHGIIEVGRERVSIKDLERLRVLVR